MDGTAGAGDIQRTETGAYLKGKCNAIGDEDYDHYAGKELRRAIDDFLDKLGGSEMKLYWHFLQGDKRLRFKPRKLVKPGSTIKFSGEPLLCEQGLHATYRALDALSYAPGPIICRVSLGGKIVEDTDKCVAQERTVLWMADATNTLHRFACLCATDALKAAGIKDQRCWEAIRVKLLWLKGKATNEELAAAWDAAWDAAWAAARAAAWAAARDAAWDDARDAAREKQNRRLHSMFLRLEP